MEQLNLFAPVGPAEPSPRVSELARKLPEGLHHGTSSWSFPGWQGIVYDRKASHSTLARHGLAAYAQHPLFRTVCIDRTYYRPAPAAELARYREAVPEAFRFVVKAHGLLTRARREDDRTASNPTFLDAAYAEDEVVGPSLEGLGPKLGVVLFQFPPQTLIAGDRFFERLHRMLESLPGEVPYAVELRNQELLQPAYAGALDAAGAVHCFNVHPAMPPLSEQARRLARAPAAPLVVRWMLRRNHTYGDAKDAFFPFDRLVEPDDASRGGVAELVRTSERAFVIVNNKAEGSAPLSLVRLAEEILR